MIIYPDALKVGDKVGVTAMSAGVCDERGRIRIDKAISKFVNKGFEIVETPDLRTNSKFVSADASTRTNEFLSLWNDVRVKYMPIAFGGEFLMETIPFLNDNKILIEKYCPKWVQGFSDVSLLLFYLTTNFNIATLHSYSFSAFSMNEWHKSISTPFDFVTNPTSFEQVSFKLFEKERIREAGLECASFNLGGDVVYKELNGAKNVNMSGRLIGGCMDVIKLLLGTPFDATKKFCSQFSEGMIWYLENCEMSIADVKRTLWQMSKAGWFDNANGFLIGRTASCEDMEDFTYQDALLNTIGKLGVPVVYDVDIGHVAPQWTIVNGSFGSFSFEDGRGKLFQELK